jgi:predicted aspartyl protease
MTYHFKRNAEDELIIVTLRIDGRHDFKMLLDTGASHTTIDSNALYMIDYNSKDVAGIAEIETGNGIIEAEILEISTLSSLGITRENFPVQVYDFLSHGIFSDYNGVLGLDFFKKTKFCIDMGKNIVTVMKDVL